MLLCFTLFLNSFLRLIKLNPTEWFSSLNSCIQARLDFENSVFFSLKTNQKCVGDHCLLQEKKSLRSYLHPFLFQESSQGALNLTNISWALWGVGVEGAFEAGLNGGPLALINLKSFCIFSWLHTLGAVLLITPLQGKQCSWRACVSFYQTRAVGRGCLSQQHWSENSSMAII